MDVRLLDVRGDVDTMALLARRFMQDYPWGERGTGMGSCVIYVHNSGENKRAYAIWWTPSGNVTVRGDD